MRFGIYCEMQTPPGKSHYDMTWEIMGQIEHADQCGFDVYSTIDHHFFPKFSISANPLAMFAAAAQRTTRIRFRTALHTLPLENPMRLAGMIAETDILTNGRLECGLGRGHAWLFGPSSLPLEESRPRYNEAVDILELAFTKETFSYHGKYYNVDNVSVVPRPIQKPYPKFYTGGTSDITYQTAGEKGWGIFVPPLLPWKVLEGPINIYKKACADHGHQPDIVYIPPYISTTTRATFAARSNRQSTISWRSMLLRWNRFRVKRKKRNCARRVTVSMPAVRWNRSRN
jgi:alkanesulfonate monooxygenase SsuD/methylene tetrahydromethanopterin reductase-like flavin-dependent oxidoreductase (luciferase family)